jgi:predicted nucleic acid-binding protein
VAERPLQLADAIAPGASLLIDSSVVLAYLAGREATSARAEELFDAFVATGRNPASISMITVAEILVRPFRSGTRAVATAEAFLQHFADVRLVPVSYEVARQAASLRAAAGLPMPDSLIVSSAIVTGADLIVTNDRSWRRRLETVVPAVEILDLSA